MANEITKPQPNVFEAYGDAATGNRIVGRLLKFNKGDYLMGQHGEVVADGTQMVPVMDSLMAGFVKWYANAPIEQVMGKIVDGYVPPPRSDLDDQDESLWERDDRGQPRDPWQRSNYLIMISRTSPADIYTFTASSKGGLDAIGELCKVYGRHIRQQPNEYPAIRLESGSYLHPNKTFGRVKFPTFPIADWVAKGPYLKALEGETGGPTENNPGGGAILEAIEEEKQERAAKAARRGAALAETF
jgi:hypothetical protein